MVDLKEKLLNMVRKAAEEFDEEVKNERGSHLSQCSYRIKDSDPYVFIEESAVTDFSRKEDIVETYIDFIIEDGGGSPVSVSVELQETQGLVCPGICIPVYQFLEKHKDQIYNFSAMVRTAEGEKGYDDIDEFLK